MTLEQLKRQYLEHLEIEKGRSLKTIANYDRYLNRFFDFSKIAPTEPRQRKDSASRLSFGRRRGGRKIFPRHKLAEYFRINGGNFLLSSIWRDKMGDDFFQYFCRRGFWKKICAKRIPKCQSKAPDTERGVPSPNISMIPPMGWGQASRKAPWNEKHIRRETRETRPVSNFLQHVSKSTVEWSLSRQDRTSPPVGMRGQAVRPRIMQPRYWTEIV